MTMSGVERQPADFGQTLFVWGIPSGPYLVLPIVGPSNPRDGVGNLVDSYADPFTILANAHGVTELTTGRLIVGGVDERAEVMDVLDDLQKNSLDFYAQLRSLSQQHRAAELRHVKRRTPRPTSTTTPAARRRPQPNRCRQLRRVRSRPRRRRARARRPPRLGRSARMRPSRRHRSPPTRTKAACAEPC